MREVLVPLPADMPGIVIVQHMPKAFTASFAESLNKECQLNVCEAGDGDKVERGKVLISPGDQHMMLKLVGKTICCCHEQWRTCKPAPAFSRCPFPISCKSCWKKVNRSNSYRNGVMTGLWASQKCTMQAH